MPMRNPPHPGQTIRTRCLEPLDLTVTAAAEALGVTRKTLSLLLNGHAGISAEMAVRLSKGFGSTPEFWLRLQMNYDLAQARKTSSKLRVRKMYGPPASSRRPSKRKAS